MPTELDPQQITKFEPIELESRYLALGWHNALLAADKGAGAIYGLDQTMHVAQYENGIMLMATDSTVMFRCWVPVYSHEESDLVDDSARWQEPTVDEKPISEILVQCGRVSKAFIDDLIAATNSTPGKPGWRGPVTLATGVLAPKDNPSLFDHDERLGLLMSARGEAIEVPLHQNSPIPWYDFFGTLDGMDIDYVKSAGFSMGNAARLGKIKQDGDEGWFPKFRQKKYIEVTCPGTPAVHGVIGQRYHPSYNPAPDPVEPETVEEDAG